MTDPVLAEQLDYDEQRAGGYDNRWDAASLSLVDGSPAMLARNPAASDGRTRTVVADLRCGG